MKHQRLVATAAIGCAFLGLCLWLFRGADKADASSATDVSIRRSAAIENEATMRKLVSLGIRQNVLVEAFDPLVGTYLQLVPPGSDDIEDDEAAKRKAVYEAIRNSPLWNDLIARFDTSASIRFDDNHRLSELHLGLLRFERPYVPVFKRFAVQSPDALSRRSRLSLGCAVSAPGGQADNAPRADIARKTAFTAWDMPQGLEGLRGPQGGSAVTPATGASAGKGGPANKPAAQWNLDDGCSAESYEGERLAFILGGKTVAFLSAVDGPSGPVPFLSVFESGNAVLRLDGELLGKGGTYFVGHRAANLTVQFPPETRRGLITIWLSEKQDSNVIFQRTRAGRFAWTLPPTAAYQVALANALKGWNPSNDDAVVRMARRASLEQLIREKLASQNVSFPPKAESIPSCTQLRSRSRAALLLQSGISPDGVTASNSPVTVAVLDALSGEIHGLVSNVDAKAICKDSRGEYQVHSNKSGARGDLICRGKAEYGLCVRSIGSTAKGIVSAAVLAAHPEYQSLQIPASGWGVACPTRGDTERLCSKTVIGVDAGSLAEAGSRYGDGTRVGLEAFIAQSMNRYAASLLTLAARTDTARLATEGDSTLVPADEFWIEGKRYNRFPSRQLVYNQAASLVRGRKPSEFPWAQEARALFDIQTSNPRSARQDLQEERQLLAAKATWGSQLANSREMSARLAELVPESVNLGLDNAGLEFRGGYVNTILGAGSSLWSPVHLAQAYSRMVVGRKVDASMVAKDSATSSRPLALPLSPTGDAAVGRLVRAFRGVIQPGATGRELKDSITRLEQLARQKQLGKLVVYAKTGTPAVDASSSTKVAGAFNRLSDERLVTVLRAAGPGGRPHWLVSILGKSPAALKWADLTSHPQGSQLGIDRTVLELVKRRVEAFNALPGDQQEARQGTTLSVDATGAAHDHETETAVTKAEGNNVVLVAALYRDGDDLDKFTPKSGPFPIAATAVVVHVHEKKENGFPAGAINIMYSLLQEDGVVARELGLAPRGAN